MKLNPVSGWFFILAHFQTRSGSVKIRALSGHSSQIISDVSPLTPGQIITIICPASLLPSSSLIGNNIHLSLSSQPHSNTKTLLKDLVETKAFFAYAGNSIEPPQLQRSQQ